MVLEKAKIKLAKAEDWLWSQQCGFFNTFYVGPG
jgi:hypothetical protein